MPQIDELNPINLSKAQPPLTFAAANVRFLSRFPDGADELWSADIKACRHGTLCEVFDAILFVESTRSGHGTAHIFGIEFEDGYPKGLNPALAGKQQAFIEFLRGENAKDDGVLGWTRKLFTGHEYAAEGKATAAYLAVRESKLHIGVGYRNDAGGYELVAVDSESWVEAAGLSFDELGKD
jgi:hypothetical protein